MDQSPPLFGWLFEFVGPLVWVALAVFFTYSCIKRKELTRLAFLRDTVLVP